MVCAADVNGIKYGDCKAGSLRRPMPEDDLKWGVLTFTDQKKNMRYALGLHLHPFGLEKPLLIGQLSSDFTDIFMPFLRSRAATIGASFFDFNSFNPHASMHVVLHIYGSLDVQAALNSSAPYEIVFIIFVVCTCFCKFNSCLHRVYHTGRLWKATGSRLRKSQWHPTLAAEASPPAAMSQAAFDAIQYKDDHLDSDIALARQESATARRTAAPIES